MTSTSTAGAVGLIGIGAMGWPMALNLHRRGLAPVVRDIDPQAVARAAVQGLAVAESPAALAARCATLLVVVVDAAQIDEVLFGPDGVVQAQPPAGAPQTVLLCSTIAAEDTERFHRRLAEHGRATVDAPISGGPARAGRGELSMMVAAARADRERVDPLLHLMASTVHDVGERVGDAARVKLVNNLLAGINLVAGAEALALGRRLGLDPNLLLKVINASSGGSWIVADRMPRALAGDYAPRARASILAKDLRLAVAMAQQAGAATALGEQALAVFRATLAAGRGDEDDASVLRTLYPDF
ncbi:MAG: NAD(P)-dependent oxidoreductase [Vitreoscilla sp.]|nr:NAD(P)-dependent oxidoreductase [Vitreoscilla sp.]